MQNMFLFPLIAVVTFCLSSSGNSYDRCKDILRDGVRDTLSTHDSFDSKLAAHQEFCSIAKENDLNDTNFDAFARDYAGSSSSNSGQYGGGLDLGIKLFSLGANYGQNNSNQRISIDEKEALLRANKTKILQYYRENCGQGSLEESLQSEAVLLSRIANPDIVAAWRECMVDTTTGFFVDLVPCDNSLEEEQLEYTMMLSYKTTEGTKINSVELGYRKDLLTTPYETIAQYNNHLKTVNLCASENFTLENGANFPLSLVPEDRTTNTSIRVMTKTNTGISKSHALVLPKRVLPDPITLDDDGYWTMEHYCNNHSCSDHMQSIHSVRHEIGENFVAQDHELNGGTCERCGQFKSVRFGFRNCRYKFIGKRSMNNVIIETDEDLAYGSLRYSIPHRFARDFYSAIKVTTAPL